MLEVTKPSVENLYTGTSGFLLRVSSVSFVLYNL